MNKKIFAIIACIAMLISALSVYTYAIDVEIDLSDLFETEPSTPDISEPTDPDEGDTTEPDDGDDGKSNDKNTSSPGVKPSKNNNSSKNDNTDNTDNSETVKEEPVEWENPFTDVKESDWYYDTVKYVSENGIFNGMTEDTFVPGSELTRAMLVTVLYRVEGSPRLNSDSIFSDVDLDDWYGAAVIWAAENGIVNGVSETEFAPNNAITREQIAAIMFRYAKAKDMDVSVGENTNILSYDDADAVSEYAIEAIQYTVGSGLMKGKTETTLNPKDLATRAEAATVIMRFLENNA